MNFKKRACGYGSGSESETEKVDDDSDDWGEIINFKDFSFDEWIDTCSGKRRFLKNAKVDGKITNVIRLGPEFDGGMHTWFGDE
ncbi:hypothetical protein F8M41_007878 [Gigaspora margarita]|uniref:Uncharacterized protein n=1 Tax=Gigaspora margarita TaxID=4874 RepID=A0A8H3X5R6_GIGMA|nr:hypothetical protein F8M41_007878 [Gigaspora margarita]